MWYIIIMKSLPITMPLMLTSETIRMIGDFVKTIKEIAEMAGVSPTTVSRVLNDRPDVNKQTKEAVLKVIEQMHYIPNANAKNLKATASNAICIIVKGIGNLFLLSILEKMQVHIEKEGYIAYVHYIDESDDEVEVSKRLLVEKKPQGIIFLGGSAVNRGTALKPLYVPAVFAAANASELALKHVSSVSVDDRKSAKMAVEELLSLGHRAIVVLGGNLQGADIVGNRFLGVEEAYKARQLHFDKRYYFESKFTLESAYRATLRILESDIAFSAMFCMSDYMAIGAAKALLDRGLQIPRDVSVIGFDGIELSRFYTPSLASVRQPVADIAKKSVEVLVSAIKGERQGQHITVQSELLLGQSIAGRYQKEQSDDIKTKMKEGFLNA